MNVIITRRQLLQRGAAGAALLSLPGLLSACGGGGGGGTGGGTSETLRFSNWQYYIDIDDKTKKSPTLEQFTAETGIKVDYFEDINSNDEYFGKIQGPLSQGQSIDREIIVHDGQLALPGAPHRGRLAGEARQGQDPQHLQPAGRAPEPAVRPGSLVLAALAVGHDGHRLQREADLDTHHHGRPAARGLQAQGQGHTAQRDGGHHRRRHAGERRRPVDGDRRVVPEGDRPRAGGRRLGADPPVHRQRLHGAADHRAT